MKLIGEYCNQDPRNLYAMVPSGHVRHFYRRRDCEWQPDSAQEGIRRMSAIIGLPPAYSK